MELALSTIGEWFGSAIISNLVDTASSYLGEHMLPADTECELQTVKAALPKIAAVMSVGEALKLKHPKSGVNAWLEQFKEAFFAAEDVLDELKYRELEDMVKARDQVSGSSISIIDSLKRKFPSSKISEDTLKRLRKAVQLLNLAVSDIGLFFQFATALDVHGLAKPNNDNVYTSSRETTSFLTETKVVGRENERAMIIEWLKKPASHGNISGLCIVGVGGLGKTTLAQLIFEEISRENQFNKTIWVCVSTSFSIVDITRKILEELGEKCRDIESLNCLQMKLKEKVLSKKILFVLDDVWNDDKMCDWERLIAPLRIVQQGSKILLTTRMKSVANMLARVLNVERENIVLEGLKEPELLELFNKYAFSGYNPNNQKDLQKIGNDIVKKLRGSPLATKVIGSLLNSNMDSNYWKRILKHDSLINLEQAKDVADVLKLSYYHLPAHLQECFRFCSIFPQDYLFQKDELIKMWMASGFTRQVLRGEERPEDIGEEYFNHLYRKSFFEQRFDHYYVMHDLIHDLAQNVSEGECCRVEPNGKSDNIPITAQHVSVPESKIERIFNLRNLRTLVINLHKDHINRDRFVPPNGSLKETLRLLVIQGEGRCELPEEIGCLLHLRFLKINLFMTQSYRYLLPHSIYKLYHLQVLHMFISVDDEDVEDVETIGMTNLVSLRYMNIPTEMMKNIHGVHKLTSLQELDFFVGRKSGHHIDELEMLNNLRSLSIEEIDNVGGPVEAKNANLSKKESLISLSLSWTDDPEQVIDNPEQVIDNLQPNRNLKELTIRCYKGNRSPNWMRDSSHLYLSSLTLDSCHNWKALPFLGKIPHLKQLSLQKLFEVKEVDFSCDSTSDCAFPSLERLYCFRMPNWESWAGAHNCYGFPNLKELEISSCPNLAKLPAIPFSLFNFQVDKVGLNSLPDMHHGSSNTAPEPSRMKSLLREVTIIGCPKLTSLNGFLQQEDLDLQAIEKLAIRNCNRILRLPTELFEKLACMKYLIFEYDFSRYSIICPNLNKLPKIPLSLNGFTIKNVGVIDLPEYFQCSRLSGPTSSSLKASLRDVEMYNCPRLTSLNGFLQQENIDLRGLEKLAIEDCNNLVQLPTGAFGNFGSLKHLVIKGSPNMVTVDNQSIFLPVNLESLTIGNCGELDVSLLESASQLSKLVGLTIQNSANITCIPSSENAFTSLSNLNIYGCNKLIEISSMPQTQTVNPGNNLVSLKIKDLYIDHLCLLLIEPLRCLRFVSHLNVDKCSEALPEHWLLQNSSTLRDLTIWDASSLRSLPGTMVRLTALEALRISKATLLEEVPELPPSLGYFYRDSKKISLNKAL